MHITWKDIRFLLIYSAVYLVLLSLVRRLVGDKD